MKFFYRGLKDGQPKDVALQAAKLKYLAQSSEPLSAPLYWASFILLGDHHKIDLTEEDYTLYYGLSIIILLVAIGFLKKNRSANNS